MQALLRPRALHVKTERQYKPMSGNGQSAVGNHVRRDGKEERLAEPHKE